MLLSILGTVSQTLVKVLFLSALGEDLYILIKFALLIMFLILVFVFVFIFGSVDLSWTK